MSLPISGDNSFFLALYARYLQDPESVPSDWRLHFETQDLDDKRPTIASPWSGEALCLAYRTFGYRQADLDPLGLICPLSSPEIADARKAAQGILKLTIAGQATSLSATDAEVLLNRLYCGTAAIEADQVVDRGDRDWLYETFERERLAVLGDDQLTMALEAVLLADEFESAVKIRFPTKKRFGSEGSESSAVILRQILRMAAAGDFREVVIGGMHRGRLATLATVAGKSLPALVAEMKGLDTTGGGQHFTGDVPYHNGLAATVDTGKGAIDIRILPHPSHLTVVAAVALGAARARRELRMRDGEADAVLPLLMHTDAAFAGQGLVSELLQLGGLKGYTAGGTIHLVVNNQIGFTTLPEEGRSTPWPTDIGKAYGIPVFHVNGDDPIAAASVARIAFLWRKRTGRDAIIDLVCYRRNGHNELDEPRFTQPRMWAAIDSHPALKTSFSERVKELSLAAFDSAEARREKFAADLVDAFKTYQQPPSNIAAQETIVFPQQRATGLAGNDLQTGLALATLRDLGRAVTAIPDSFDPAPKVRIFNQTRFDNIENGGPIDIATAEALAFASLLAEGISVRLSGQDSVRGTFTQRHLAVHHRETGEVFMALEKIAKGAARFDAINSPLIEYGVLGFEYGMSLADPDRLIMWEAQFGDFLNGAQIAVDQYITTAEAKWQMQSSLVIALPHGLEGQGPDHSSARIERILQSCLGDNIIVANPSTPANLFHLLRRQQKNTHRRPLFFIAPKSLLRHKSCVSPLTDFGPGTGFAPVLVTQPSDPCQRVILCSGKICYLLEEERTKRALSDIAIIRIEQLYPLPLDTLRDVIDQFSGADLVWCQEEPRNQGAYSYLREHFWEAFPGRDLRYAGRPPMAAAAGGSIDRHEDEQAVIIASAFESLQNAPMVAE